MPATLVQIEHHAPFYAVEIRIYFAALELHPLFCICNVYGNDYYFSTNKREHSERY